MYWYLNYTLVISAEYGDMNRGQLLAKIHELEEVSDVFVFLCSCVPSVI